MKILCLIVVPIRRGAVDLVHQLVGGAIRLRIVTHGEARSRVCSPRHTRDRALLEITANVVTVAFIARHIEETTIPPARAPSLFMLATGTSFRHRNPLGSLVLPTLDALGWYNVSSFILSLVSSHTCDIFLSWTLSSFSRGVYSPLYSRV